MNEEKYRDLARQYDEALIAYGEAHEETSSPDKKYYQRLKDIEHNLFLTARELRKQYPCNDPKEDYIHDAILTYPEHDFIMPGSGGYKIEVIHCRYMSVYRDYYTFCKVMYDDGTYYISVRTKIKPNTIIQ